MPIRNSYIAQNINDQADLPINSKHRGGLFFHAYFLHIPGTSSKDKRSFLEMPCMTVMAVQSSQSIKAHYPLAPARLLESVEQEYNISSRKIWTESLFYMTILPLTKLLSSLAFIYRDGIVPILVEYALVENDRQASLQ